MTRTVRLLAEAALLGLMFFLLASISITLTRFEGGAAFLWLATAPLFAFLVVRPPREWIYALPATAAASLLASTLFGVGPLVGIPIAFGIVAEAALPAFILRLEDKDLAAFDSIPALIRFVVIAGLVAPACSAVIGAAAIAHHTGQDFWPNWWAWFAAHSLGTISFAPLLLLSMRGRLMRWLREADTSARWEAGLLLLSVALTTLLVFQQQRYPLLFLPILPLIVTTFRLGQLGAAGSVVLLAAVGGLETLGGHGPISLMQASAGARAQFFQFYLATAVMIVLPAAAELRHRESLHLRIRRTGAAYRLLADNLGDTLIHTSPEGEVIYASPAVSDLTGYSPSDVVGRNSRDFVLESDYANFAAAREKALAKPEQTVSVEYRVSVRSGAVIWCETRLRGYTDEKGLAEGVILAVRDVTARKAAEVELTHAATTDPLTDLPNRRAFSNRLTYLQQEVASGHGTGCVAVFDLDHFKAVNDTYGHSIGDDVLKSVAMAALEAVRSGDMVARIGGEEFAVVLWGASLDGARHTCERIRTAIEASATPLESGRTVKVTASFGVAEIRKDSRIEDVVQAADRALYAAKAAGRNRLRIAA